MDTSIVKIPPAAQSAQPDLRYAEDEKRKIIFWDGIATFFKLTGMMVWFVIMLLTLLEIKRYFNIDLIPGYDSALDTAYEGIRQKLGNP